LTWRFNQIDVYRGRVGTHRLGAWEGSGLFVGDFDAEGAELVELACAGGEGVGDGVGFVLAVEDVGAGFDEADGSAVVEAEAEGEFAGVAGGDFADAIDEGFDVVAGFGAEAEAVGVFLLEDEEVGVVVELIDLVEDEESLL